MYHSIFFFFFFYLSAGVFYLFYEQYPKVSEKTVLFFF